MPGLVKIAGVWKNIDQPYVKIGGVHKAVTNGYVKVGGVWKEWYNQVPPLPPGQYTLPTTAGGGSSSFVEADTTPYRGRITEIRVLISYGGSMEVGKNTSVAGRPSANNYRSITGDASWINRSIFHRIDTWDAASITEFNDGDAIGFTYGNQQFSMTNSQVVLTIV